MAGCPLLQCESGCQIIEFIMLINLAGNEIVVFWWCDFQPGSINLQHPLVFCNGLAEA